MLHYYLAPYIGAGTMDDPFRPRGSDQPGWTAIDLRADCTQQAGRALVAVPVQDARIGNYLGTDLDAQNASLGARVAAELGIQSAGTTLREIIPALLIVHAKEDGTRWRPLQPTRKGTYEVWLGREKVFETPVIRGGSTITESFNTADSDTLGPDLSWTELTGDLDVVSNQFTNGTPGATAAVSRADIDLSSVDQYAQAVIALTRGTSVLTDAGPLCRKDSTATMTFYLYRPFITATENQHDLYKCVEGTFTQLGSTDTTDFVAGNVIGVEANGSSITGYRHRVIGVGPITDSAIPGNLRAGIRSHLTAGTGVAAGNAFRAGDLTDIRTLTVATPATTPSLAHDDEVVIAIPSTTAGSTLVVMTQAGDDPNPVASVTSVVAPGATFTLKAAVTNTTGSRTVRAECWVATGVSAGITSITVTWGAVTVGVVNCAEYANVLSIGNTATATGSTANPTISVTTQDANNFAVAGFANEATAQGGFDVALRGTFWKTGFAAGDGFPDVSGCLVDNAFPTAGALSNTLLYAGAVLWAAVAVELRSAAGSVGLAGMEDSWSVQRIDDRLRIR